MYAIAKGMPVPAGRAIRVPAGPRMTARAGLHMRAPVVRATRARVAMNTTVPVGLHTQVRVARATTVPVGLHTMDRAALHIVAPVGRAMQGLAVRATQALVGWLGIVPECAESSTACGYGDISLPVVADAGCHRPGQWSHP